jgi:AraC-like DNA-binding protein
LSGVTDSVERLGKIDALLTEIYKPSHEPNFTAALHIILKTRGYIRMKELSASIGLSQRQLERIFQKRSGLTPKQMASITQFQYMANLVRNRGEESLFDLAIQGGYTDHAHFSKAFKIFSGVSPSDFIK